MSHKAAFWKVMPSGLAFNFADPQPEMISIEDIVHVLARTNRWGGNLNMVSYSVAQHSLVVASACRLPAARIYALLHDAADAYIGDLPTPFKAWIAAAGANIVGLEMHILYSAILPHFGIAAPEPHLSRDVHDADQIAAATEDRDVVMGRSDHYTPKAPPLKSRIKFIPVPKVEEQFRLALDGAIRNYRDAA